MAYLTSGLLAQSSPAIAPNGTVYIGSKNCLDAISADGKLGWKTVEGLVGKSTPALAQDGTVYIASDLVPNSTHSLQAENYCGNSQRDWVVVTSSGHYRR